MSVITFFYVLVFIFGTMIGSFLNVLICRLPKDEDVVFKRSHCTQCGAVLKWYQNIPLVSYLVLRGKCAKCKVHISIQYIIVELIMGLAAILIFDGKIGVDSIAPFLFKFSVVSVFIVHFVIDFRHKILPDSLNLYLALIFLAWSALHESLLYWSVGGAIGLLFPWFVTWAFYKVRGVIGLGGGDIKLFGALGLYLGPLGIINNIFFSCFSGAILGGIFLLVTKKGRDTQIPFGPFIIVVAFVQIFFPGIIESLLEFK